MRFLATAWIKIKNEYINTEISQRKLAQKRGTSVRTLTKKAKKENWKKYKETQRNKIATKVQQKTVEKIVNKEVDRIGKIVILTDDLLLKVQQAITELENDVVTNKLKIKTVEYKDKTAIGKPTKETVIEKEEQVVVNTLVDRLGLVQVSTALKNIKDILVSQQDDNGVKVVQIIDDIPKEIN